LLGVLLADGVDEAGVVLPADGEVTAVASGEVVAVDIAAVAGVEAVKVEAEVDTTPTTRELARIV
jgi:hypothetical protein